MGQKSCNASQEYEDEPALKPVIASIEEPALKPVNEELNEPSEEEYKA